MNPLSIIGQQFVRERDRWVLWIPVGIGAGIAIYFALPFEPPLTALIATPLLVIAAWITRFRLWAFLPLAALLSFAVGFNVSQIDTRLSYTPMLDRKINVTQVEGRLIYTEVMPDGVRLTLKDLTLGHIPPEQTPVKLRVKFGNKDLADIPPAGSRLKFWAQIGPFSDPVLPGANDFRWQSYFKQLGGLGFSYSHIEVVDAHPPDTSWHDKISLMFERARLALAQHVYKRLSGDVGAMTAARLNGEQSAISEPVIEAMRISGLAHLLSTSGFHVTIMGILIYFPLRAALALIPWLALRYPIKKWAAVGAILSTLGYTLLVGSGAATLRSMLMTGIAMLAIIADRRSNAMRLVMLSAVLAMLLAPDATLGPSFQMSFAAVFCLIATHEKTFAWATSPGEKFVMPGWLHSFTRHMGAIISTSLIATAATTPFAMYHFQTFSFYGFLANMMALPLTSFWVMPNILIAYITAPFNLDGVFIQGAGAGIRLTIKIAEIVAGLPYSIFYLTAMPWFALVLMVLGGLWFCIWRLRWRYLGALPVIIGMAYPLYTTLPDVMISPDGQEWAARLEDGRLAVENLDHDTFITRQWQERLGMPPMLDVTELPPDEKQLRCDEAGCVYHHGNHVIAFPELEAAALEDCDNADIVIAPFTLRACNAKTLIDESDFWHQGAHALTFNGDAMSITATRARRAMRPWSVGWGRHRAANDDD